MSPWSWPSPPTVFSAIPISRRRFWDQIHTLAAEGTTILVTTHYMDEAERCHRLAFIFRGAVLDQGPPAEIVDRQGLRVVEIEVQGDTRAAAKVLWELEGIDEISFFGHTLRVAFRRRDDVISLAETRLREAAVPTLRIVPARVSVEDAFVAMVHEDART